YPGLGLLSLIGKDYALEVPGFLQALARLPVGELATALLAFGRIYRGNLPPERKIEELLADRQLLVEYIEQRMSVPPEKVAGLADLIMNPAEARDDLAELIEHFWYVILPPEMERCAQLQQQIAEQCQARLSEMALPDVITGLSEIHLAADYGDYEEFVLA